MASCLRSVTAAFHSHSTSSFFKTHPLVFKSKPHSHAATRFSFAQPVATKVNFHHHQRRFSNVSESQKEGTTMTKTMKVGLFLLIGGALLTAALYASEKTQNSESQETHLFINVLNTKVLDAIEHSEEIPGLKAEEFAVLKKDISKTWNTLVENGVIEITGTDKDVRPHFVALQGVVEHVLSCEHRKSDGVKSLKGIIHTPMPATPLCSTGEVSRGLVDPAIENDPKRLFTVKARTTIIRDFLHQGGYLYCVYPKEGIAKRTEAQQSIYKQELVNYPNHLLDTPLNCSSIPDELIGATYVFTDHAGGSFAFAIKMTQAKDPKEMGSFGLWFGSLQNEKVVQRVNKVLDFIKQNGVETLEIKPPKSF